MVSVGKAWKTVWAGFGINLSLGVLYSWGVISAALIDEYQWTVTQTQIPYMTASVVFALSMIPGGRLQDSTGPRVTLIIASILAGLGFTLSSFAITVNNLTLFFGGIFGLAMGFGYAAPTPAAVKWFHVNHRGFISGIVVSGFGLAPVYIAPLTRMLIHQSGIRSTFIILGILFFLTILLLSFFIHNPPQGHEPVRLQAKKTKREIQSVFDYDYPSMLRTPQFYLLWVLFFFGTFSGLLIIGQMAKIGQEQAGIENGAILVMTYAVFNFLGRISWGSISDFLGEKMTLFLIFAVQVVVYFVFHTMTEPHTLLIGKSLVGFTFGGMLTIFPVITSQLFGLKNFGVNYGFVMTAWGIGGFLGPLFGGTVRDITGTYQTSYTVSALFCLAGSLLTFLIKKPGKSEL
ncbi:MAG: OFA family MFS transporter [Candidatus Atribacteria bacterium]|nr:OFA family MFS transporter [Candidatus Atribacteria bacterium]